jgi:hypothetical protein
MGVGRVAVSDWERGKYPIPVAVELHLRRLEQEPEYLFWIERQRGLRCG